MPKKDKNGNNTFDGRITHLVGGLAYQGNVKNNKIFIKDANMIIHGPSKAYASSAAAHISAGYKIVEQIKTFKPVTIFKHRWF